MSSSVLNHRERESVCQEWEEIKAEENKMYSRRRKENQTTHMHAHSCATHTHTHTMSHIPVDMYNKLWVARPVWVGTYCSLKQSVSKQRGFTVSTRVTVHTALLLRHTHTNKHSTNTLNKHTHPHIWLFQMWGTVTSIYLDWISYELIFCYVPSYGVMSFAHS